MKKKGFTLIELLAVILILAIIAAILSPIVRNIIESAREQADRRSVERYARAAQEYYVESQYDQNKADYLGSNILEQLDLEDIEATGMVVAYEDGSTEMAIVYHNKCYTKTTSQTVKNIEVSDDTSNCVVSSSSARIASINSKANSIDINVEISDVMVSLTSCKFGTDRNNLSNNGTISGSTCTLAPTVSGTRYYYQLIFSDGTTRNGSIQGGAGIITPSGGGTGSGGASTGVAAPVLEGENGQTTYAGRMVSPVQIKYFNVSTGTKCDDYAWQQNSGTGTGNMSSGCLRFYVYMEDNLSYTMILDRNIADAIAWASSGVNTSGPSTLSAKLKELTNSWKGTITPKNYKFIIGAAPYIIPYDTEGYHARLITTSEIARIVGKNDFNPNTTPLSDWFYFDGGAAVSSGQTWQTQKATSSQKSAYYWLYDYTEGCEDWGCNKNAGVTGYWTSDAIAETTNKAWLVSRRGRLDDVSIITGGFTSCNLWTIADQCNFGVRPVISVLKSVID